MHIGFSLAFFSLGAICLSITLSFFLTNLWFILLLWPSLVYLTISISYSPCGNGGRVGVKLIHKNERTGEIPLFRIVLLFPFLFCSWGWWYFRQTVLLKGKENPYDLISKNIYVGRYPLWYPNEFPMDAKNVIDCTGEFPAIQCLTRGRNYLCCRGMDMQLPSNEDLIRVAKEGALMKGDIYIHCANGHGRSASVAALIMMLRGDAKNVDDAFTIMQKSRPKIHIHQNQLNILLGLKF